MTNDLVTRLVEFEFSDNLGNGDFSVCYEAADRIEELERQLSLINNTLDVTLNEKITTNWKEFCEALIEETREFLGEDK